MCPYLVIRSSGVLNGMIVCDLLDGVLTLILPPDTSSLGAYRWLYRSSNVHERTLGRFVQLRIGVDSESLSFHISQHVVQELRGLLRGPCLKQLDGLSSRDISEACVVVDGADTQITVYGSDGSIAAQTEWLILPPEFEPGSTIGKIIDIVFNQLHRHNMSHRSWIRSSGETLWARTYYADPHPIRSREKRLSSCDEDMWFKSALVDWYIGRF